MLPINLTVTNGYIIRQLTENTVDDENPQISDGNVVWDAPGEVYLSQNGDQPILLDDDLFLPALPQISGNNVAWMNTEYGLYGSTFDIYFYNGNTSSFVPSSGDAGVNPQISENNVVWEGNDGGDWEIYLYDGNTTVQLTNNDFDDENPQISGSNVVWQGNQEIYLYDGNTTVQLTNNDFNDENPQISGSNIVWQGNQEIYLYDGNTTVQLTNNDFDDENPQISGSNIVWQGNQEIYLYDGNTTTQITNNDFDDRNPQISENNIVWEGNDSDDWEIYLATSDNESTPPENTIDLYRFRNNNFETGTYVFVSAAERDIILDDNNLNTTFSLDGEQEDGTLNPAFKASLEPGDGLIPFYRLKSIDVPGTFLFVSTAEYDAIFADNSEQKNKWQQEGLNENEEDIPEFYLLDSNADRGIQFNRFQNTQNGTFLYAGPAETEAIESDPSLSSIFINQGIAFESLI